MEKLNNYILWDYEIELEEGISLKFFLIYKMINNKVKVLKDII